MRRREGEERPLRADTRGRRVRWPRARVSGRRASPVEGRWPTKALCVYRPASAEQLAEAGDSEGEHDRERIREPCGSSRQERKEMIHVNGTEVFYDQVHRLAANELIIRGHFLPDLFHSMLHFGFWSCHTCDFNSTSAVT